MPEVLQTESGFDPSIHLAYRKPKATQTFADIMMESSPISEVASTDPFQLLSKDGVKAFRRELFSEAVLDNCMYKTRAGSVQIRGMAPRFAPFSHQFWTSPEVLSIVSSLAGVDLIPVMDQEICHTNVQLGPGGLDSVRCTPVDPSIASPGFMSQSITNDPHTSLTVVPWHRDSHPFVCIVMLSDTANMTGGETAIRRGDGSTLKINSPTLGGAVILQGRYVSHVAIPAENMPERITLVTSFRPRSPLLVDDSSLMNVRTKSLLPELYYQWTHYRLRLLSQRFEYEAVSLAERYSQVVRKCDTDGRPGHCRFDVVNVRELECWMNKQILYMRQTIFEMRPVTVDDNVNKDFIPAACMST